MYAKLIYYLELLEWQVTQGDKSMDLFKRKGGNMETIISRLHKDQKTMKIPHITFSGGQTAIREIILIDKENDKIIVGKDDFQITIKISEITKVS